MRVGIDARPLQGETQYRGIGKALESMLHALRDELPETDQLVFYVDATLPIPRMLTVFGSCHYVKIPSTRLGQKRYFRSVLPSYRTAKPSKSDVDVFLQYDAYLGVPTSVPTVAVIHDLIPLLFRDQEKKQPVSGLRKYKNKLAGSLYWKKYLRTLAQYRNARAIIAISNSSQADYEKYFKPGKGQKISVIHHGVQTRAAPQSVPSNKQLQRITSAPYLLYVGGIDLRKNIATLLTSFFELKTAFPDLKLIVVGKEFALTNQLQDLGWPALLRSNPLAAKDVHLLGFIPDKDLAWLYAHAKAFVFPSRYEGFGLPVLEAMQAGCPVVAYNNSSIPEVAGDAAILVKDGESMVPAITKVLTNEKLREELIKKGKEQAQQFTWEKTARETLRVLEGVR